MPGGYQDLEVYKRSWRMLRPVHALALTFPDYEKYDLASQIRRAAKSIPANIAEGHTKRRSPKEFCAYLMTAMGSANELRVHFEIAMELEYITADKFAEMSDEYEIIARQLASREQTQPSNN